MVHPVPSADDGLDHLIRWYAAQCDGDREHEFGIRIETLDNPGWHVEVDLEGTELEGRLLERGREELEGGGWIFVRSTGAMFEVSGDPLSLGRALHEFRRFAESA